MKNINLQRIFFVFMASVALLAASTAQGQESRPKMSAPQEEALKYFTSTLAFQAATWGSPIVTMYALRYNDALSPNAKAAPNTVWRMDNITTPAVAEQEGYVMPNTRTIYGFGFLDLGPEPVIMTLPDSHGHYYLLECVDMWTNDFYYPAGKVHGYKGGKYAMVGPGWKGTLPPGVKRIDVGTRWMLIQPRMHVHDLTDPADVARARTLLAEVKLQGLAEYTGKAAPPAPKYSYAAPDFVNPKLPVSVLDFRDPLQFWEILSAAMNENPPPPDQITALLPMFRPLGLELGKQWDRSKVNPITLQSMAEAAQKIAPTMEVLPFGKYVNGWFLPPIELGDPGDNFKIRANEARIGLTGNTTQEAVYWIGFNSVDGALLDGSNRYTITFTKQPEVIAPGWWGLFVYNGKDSYPVANALNRYSLGSDNSKTMKLNSDGSLTLYLQATDPGPDKQANWLPVNATGTFRLAMRAYAPADIMIKSLIDPSVFPPAPMVKVP